MNVAVRTALEMTHRLNRMSDEMDDYKRRLYTNRAEEEKEEGENIDTKEYDKEKVINSRYNLMTICKAEDKGKYSIVQLIRGRKNKATDKCEIDYKNDYIRFCGTAYDKLKNMTFPTAIRITESDVVKHYEVAESKSQFIFIVYDFIEAEKEGEIKEEEG